jgi:hypothetical protein
MKAVLSIVLLGAVATATGCGSGGGSSNDKSPATQPAASRADAPASPGASPSTPPPNAAKADTGAKATSPAPAAPTTQRVLGLPAGWEIAPRANYTARQAAGQVTVTAKGQNPTGGYEVKLVQSPLRIWPPQWILAHKKPDGMATQAITPFETSASFKSDRKVATVVVNDAEGRRLVNVAQAQN